VELDEEQPMKYSFLILVFLCFPCIGFSQTFSNGFEFYLPPDDTTTQEFLPHFPIIPIGADDFVSIDSEGHFSINNKRLRFFGTNFTTAGAFPVKSKADFIAGRLRKMGYNLVRFHHMDNGWSRHSLFEWGGDTRHLNPETLDRFDNMIFYLKDNGIYANINLHVSRSVKEEDGITDADSIPDFGTFTWISLTDSALSTSRRSLFTLSSKVQNTNMLWDGITTVHNRWGGAPTEMYPLTLSVELFLHADSVMVYPLDERGDKTDVVYVYQPSAPDRFSIPFDQNRDETVWFGIETFGLGTAVKRTSNVPDNLELSANYPNPFNPRTQITYHIPSNGHVTLDIYNVRGRLLATVVNKVQQAGQYTVSVANSDWSSGTYLYRLTMGEASIVRKMALVR